MINNTHFGIVWMNMYEQDEVFKIFDVNGTTLSGATSIDKSVIQNYDVCAAHLKNRTMFGYVDSAEGDFDAIGFWDNATIATLAVAEFNPDATMASTLNWTNTADCHPINNSAAVYAWIDYSGTDAATYSRWNWNGIQIGSDAVIDADVGNAGSIAVTGLDAGKFAVVWSDGTDQDITMAIRWSNDTSILAATDINTTTGATPIRLDVGAVHNASKNGVGYDNIAVVWTSSDSLDLMGATFDADGNRLTNDFVIDSSPNSTNTFSEISILGKNDVANMSMCPDTWGVAYTNSTGATVFKSYFTNGSVWSMTADSEGGCAWRPVPNAVPKWTNNLTNSSTIAGTNIFHSVNLTDDVALSSYIFSFDNGSGTLVNDSPVTIVGVANWSNVTKAVNTTVGAIIKWKVYFNDSSDAKNDTGTFQYITIPGDFISTWNTSKAGSDSVNLTLPLQSTGTYNFNIGWGDGIINNSVTTSLVNHTYAAEGVYTITINGSIEGFSFNNSGDKLKLLNISQWGVLKLGNTGAYFFGASNFNSNATDAPNLSKTTNLSHAFVNAVSFDGNISNWNVGNVTNMTQTFNGSVSFNQNLSLWDTGNVTTMFAMFYNATAFNGNISNWNVSKVINMESMFQSATVFNQNITNWNTSRVTTIASMFQSAISFNQNLSLWDVRNVTAMTSVFNNATVFNQNLTNWNTTKVKNMNNVFLSATAFNGNISNWNTSNVTSMTSMFASAIAFNQNLTTWDVSNVTSMLLMFQSAKAFDGNISNWNVGNSTSFALMFNGATAFNGNISSWNTSKVNSMSGMFSNATSFNQDISNWDTGKVTSMGGTLATSGMFFNAKSFNQNLSNWNTSNLQTTGLVNTFANATSFNGNISNWNISKVTFLNNTFDGAVSFNQDISNWNISKVTSLHFTFRNATSFNGNITNWDTSKVVFMRNTFANATSFNGNITNWDVSNVTNMSFAFSNATSFNGNLSIWVTNNVTSMNDMFANATSFNGNLSNWNVSAISSAAEMFSGVTLSIANYNSLLNGWAGQTPNLINNTVFDGGNSKYSLAGNSSRNGTLIGFHNWAITDGGFEVVLDSCTYSSGNWNVLCSDNCVITSNVAVGGNAIFITGTGTFTTEANITQYKNLTIRGTDTSNKCVVRCFKGGCFRAA
jgi:surface protein